MKWLRVNYANLTKTFPEIIRLSTIDASSAENYNLVIKQLIG